MSSHYQQYLRSVSAQNAPPPSTNRIIPRKLPAQHRDTFSHSQPLTSNAPSSSPSHLAPPATHPNTNASNTPIEYSPAPSTISSFPQPPSHKPSKESISSLPVKPLPITKEQTSAALQTCLTLQSTATRAHNKRPFAALLLAPDNTTVLLTHFSMSHIRHAESELARLAADHFSTFYLSTCTLVSTWEPCAMCSGTIYWAGIGRVIYAASEEKLRALTGTANEENMTMSMPCRNVFSCGQRDVEVVGPVPLWEEKVVEECAKWWSRHGGSLVVEKNGGGSGLNGGENGNAKQHARAESVSVVTTWKGEENVMSSIGEDGEYKADLDIDWMR